MCLTIVYGAYELFGHRRTRSTNSPATSADTSAELKSFVADVTGKLVSEKVSNEYQYMISQAGAQWNKDPFIASIAPLKKRLGAMNPVQNTAANTKKSVQYVYSGFMQLGAVKLAIINGLEYAEGEVLPDKSFYVKSISPQKVVIGKVKGLETIQVSISENDASSGI